MEINDLKGTKLRQNRRLKADVQIRGLIGDER